MARLHVLHTLRRMLLPLLGFFFAGCSGTDPAADAFLQRFAASCSTLAVGNELRLAALNNEDWDAFFFFPPYTTAARIELAIKQKLPANIARSGIGERDDINLFVFLNSETVQMAAAVPRKDFDVSVPIEQQPLNRGSAVFVKSTAGGAFTLQRPLRKE